MKITTQKDNTLLLEEVQLIFRNFAGKESEYNREGKKEFGVLLDPEAAALMADSWNVKQLKVREEDLAEDPKAQGAYWLPVAMGYGGGGRPPRVVLVTSNNRKNLDETEVPDLDWADIVTVDLIVRPYTWEVQGRGGVKAYLQSMYVTINEDPLQAKYDAQQQTPS